MPVSQKKNPSAYNGRPVALVDIDSTLLDFPSGMKYVLESRGVYGYDPAAQHDYWFNGPWGENVRQAILAEINSREPYLRAPFYEGALEALSLLKDYAYIIGYTTAPDSTRADRIALMDTLPFDSWVVYHGHSKACNVGEFPDGKPIRPDVIFDDSLGVIMSWMARPSVRYMIRRPYNMSYKDPDTSAAASLNDIIPDRPLSDSRDDDPVLLRCPLPVRFASSFSEAVHMWIRERANGEARCAQ